MASHPFAIPLAAVLPFRTFVAWGLGTLRWAADTASTLSSGSPVAVASRCFRWTAMPWRSAILCPFLSSSDDRWQPTSSAWAKTVLIACLRAQIGGGELLDRAEDLHPGAAMLGQAERVLHTA